MKTNLKVLHGLHHTIINNSVTLHSKTWNIDSILHSHLLCWSEFSFLCPLSLFCLLSSPLFLQWPSPSPPTTTTFFQLICTCLLPSLCNCPYITFCPSALLAPSHQRYLISFSFPSQPPFFVHFFFPSLKAKHLFEHHLFRFLSFFHFPDLFTLFTPMYFYCNLCLRVCVCVCVALFCTVKERLCLHRLKSALSQHKT